MSVTDQILSALCAHYRKPDQDRDGEILLPEVAAPGSSRRCDLLRIGMWASRGRGIDVHEIKTSRSDWLRELDEPAKAEAWWPYCTRMWVVAPPKLVRPEEVPEGWGLMEPPTGARRRRFRSEIEQMRLDHRDELSQAIRQARIEAETRKLSPETQRRLELLEKLEAELGAELDHYSFGDGMNLTRCTPAELAAALADYARGHILLQRRERALSHQVEHLRAVASHVLDRTGDLPS